MSLLPTSTEKTVTFVTPAHATNENADSPGYASFLLNQRLLDRLQGLLNTCKELQLSEVRFDEIVHWGPGDIEDELRLRGDTLVLQRVGTVWFSAYPKHGDYFVESECLELSMLQQEFIAASPGDVVFTSDDEDLREQFEVTPCERAASEGWGLFDWDGTGLLQIQRYDEADKFSSDDEAVEFVRQRAQAGSALHLDALRAHDQHAPAIDARRSAGGTP